MNDLYKKENELRFWEERYADAASLLIQNSLKEANSAHPETMARDAGRIACAAIEARRKFIQKQG